MLKLLVEVDHSRQNDVFVSVHRKLRFVERTLGQTRHHAWCEVWSTNMLLGSTYERIVSLVIASTMVAQICR